VTKSPEIAVVVPTHDRTLRLRWLLNALDDQTLPRDRWEAIVAHDADDRETEELLGTHPLAASGVLRHLPVRKVLPGAKRNAGWRSTNAPLIAFTDDDCRPPPDWLERALAAACGNPGAIVQGATRPDPDEDAIGYYAIWVQTQSIWPPRPWAETCNIVYPREVLEAMGGFDEELCPGEDTDLAERARAAGTPYVGAREVVNHHAVEEMSLLEAIRDTFRWKDFPEVVRRHPRLRQEFPLWMFRRHSHTWLIPAIVGWSLMRRSRLWGLLMLPYVLHAAPKHRGSHPGGRVRALLEVPARFVIDAVEMLGMAWGSFRARTLFL
jgi:GT2 family glycosyltransferase